MKFYYQNHLRTWNEEGFGRVDGFNNVTLIGDNISKAGLMELYAKNDVMVYPSYGEGFGFIPLQALATGMPVISTGEFLPYRDFLHPLEIPGRWDRSIWSVHPGKVLYPNYDALVAKLRFCQKNMNYLATSFYQQAPLIHKEYNWLDKTEKAWAHIVERFTDN
jgi:glycosyltransferase involved in cell wall biosynthesis